MVHTIFHVIYTNIGSLRIYYLFHYMKKIKRKINSLILLHATLLY